MKKNVITEKQKKLSKLQTASNTALNLVTTTIQNLTTVNEQMDVVIAEIEEEKAELDRIGNETKATQEKNSRVIDRFMKLIED